MNGVMIMIMIKEKWRLTGMSNAKIKCESLTRRNKKKKNMGEQIHVTHDTQTKIIVILTIKYTMK